MIPVHFGLIIDKDVFMVAHALFAHVKLTVVNSIQKDIHRVTTFYTKPFVNSCPMV